MLHDKCLPSHLVKVIMETVCMVMLQFNTDFRGWYCITSSGNLHRLAETSLEDDTTNSIGLYMH